MMKKTIHDSDLSDKAAVNSKLKMSKVDNKLKNPQDLDRGDGEMKWTVNKKCNVVDQRPENFGGGESRKNNSNYPCTNHHCKSCHDIPASLPANSGTKVIHFTPSMIKDQELLVASMNQQGISESLIRRQFDRLLDEQIRQLRLQEDTKSTEQKEFRETTPTKTKSKIKEMPIHTAQYGYPAQVNNGSNYSHDREINAYYSEQHQQNQHQQNQHHQNQHQQNQHQQNQHQQNQHQQNQHHQNQHQQNFNKMNDVDERNVDHANDGEVLNNAQKLEASSLLKIRLQKEVVDLQKRNNGLQEPAAALEIIKKCKYADNNEIKCESSKFPVRLNGTQDKSRMEHFQNQNIPTSDTSSKQCSANGLENSRNPQNPPPTSRSQFIRYPPTTEYSLMYPYQKCPISSYNRYSSNDESSNIDQNQNNNQHQIDNHESCGQNCEPVHENFQNLPFAPELQEPRIIGGLVYFARKPQCIPNTQNT